MRLGVPGLPGLYGKVEDSALILIQIAAHWMLFLNLSEFLALGTFILMNSCSGGLADCDPLRRPGLSSVLAPVSGGGGGGGGGGGAGSRPLSARRASSMTSERKNTNQFLWNSHQVTPRPVRRNFLVT